MARLYKSQRAGETWSSTPQAGGGPKADPGYRRSWVTPNHQSLPRRPTQPFGR